MFVDRVLIVPGNHDYGTGIRGWENYVEKFKETFLGSKNVTYPILSIIDNIAFIGLDSMAHPIKNNSRFADGKLGKSQRKELVNKLDEATAADVDHIVVYLHHHPFHQKDIIHGHHFHGLKDHDKLCEILEEHNKNHNNISALLFGHNHDGENKWNGSLGIPRCYDGGTSTGHEDFLITPHRIFDLSDETGGYTDSNFYRPYL